MLVAACHKVHTDASNVHSISMRSQIFTRWFINIYWITCATWSRERYKRTFCWPFIMIHSSVKLGTHFREIKFNSASFESIFIARACIMEVSPDVVDSGSMFGRQFSELNAFGLSSGAVDYTSIGARDTRMSRVSALLLEVISIDLAPLSADPSAISSVPLGCTINVIWRPFLTCEHPTPLYER
jgi:hypothetical protein